MKYHSIGIRVSEVEKKQLEGLAKKKGQTISSYIKDIIFDNKMAMDQLELKIMKIQESQELHSTILSDLTTTESKHFRHNILLSSSILQNRYVLAKTLSILCKVYGDKIPKEIIPSDDGKMKFIESELQKIQAELEVMN